MPAIVWKGYVSFGLVSFPVRLFAAGRAEAVHFHMLHGKDLSRVKEFWYCAEEDKPIERADIVKGYEVSKGEYVVVDEDELKKVAPPTANLFKQDLQCDLDFVPLVARDMKIRAALSNSFGFGGTNATLAFRLI